MSSKTNEKTVRLRYIRVLEKFNTKTITLLKKHDFDLQLYKKATLKAYEELKKAPTCDLFSQYPMAVKSLAQTILDTLENHSEDFQKEKEIIIKKSNLLDKLKNNNRYKKDKHKNKKFNDGY